MAEALSDDIESNISTSAASPVNYPGPRSDIQYPMNIQYCGGQFLASLPPPPWITHSVFTSDRMFIAPGILRERRR